MTIKNNVSFNNKVFFYLFSVLIFLSSFKAKNAKEEALTYSIPAPLEVLSNLSNYFIVFILLVLNIKLLSYRAKISRPLVLLFIFELVLILTEFYIDGDLNSLIINLGFTILIVVFFSRAHFVFQENVEKYSFFNSIFFGSFCFIFLNAIVVILGLGNVIWNGRLFGLTSHPNFIGLYAAIFASFTFYKLYNQCNKLKNILFYTISLILGIYIVVITGSRTALLFALLAISSNVFFSLKRYDSKIMVLLLSSIFVLLFFGYLSIDDLDYTGRSNTRVNAWSNLLKQIEETGLFGIGRGRGYTANSYFYAVVANGFLGSTLLFLVIIDDVKNLLYTQVYNIFYTSILIPMLICAFLEGFLLDTISLPILVFWSLQTGLLKVKV
ncbi:O-antigen ligase family protein [Leeuwenhoekiella palythoae]|uniref:O-antigen ligase-related domain-containing protein n=1 Tax=Leeuwenhoekiella palythoae TaxID=573501 RepID=A0A1M5UCV2_9FLAO|nr:O-antigen ligase family protein [Leeuwenhoekiella palythoae]RXG27157.1 hypothetical protein DSM01_3231 [Leeuwenhoekiella palythoae]SHH60872.1 hypothetical protein SAMN04487999_0631 [Leeuwenhoekiella palythoae]